jgi:serine phosphatase RsbU (regulator of sigma subunit)/energy-coupling factor transporter transmembrane protein EcfT
VPQPPSTDLSRHSAKRGGGLSRVALIRYWATSTFSGQAVVYGAVAKVVAFSLVLVFGASRWFELIDTCGDLAIIVGTLIVALRLFVKMKAAMLWRVRSKLTLSYIFMGFVPALLIIVFFMVAGLLLFFNIGAYMMRADLARLVDSTHFAAESAALGVVRENSPTGLHDSLQVRQAVLASRYPGTSVTLVPSLARCGQEGSGLAVPPERMVIGSWKHLPAPASIPDWVRCDGFAGLIAFGDASDTRLVARAVVWPERGRQAIIVDVPVDDAFQREMLARSGVLIKGVSEVPDRSRGDAQETSTRAARTLFIGPAKLSLGANGNDGRMVWIGDIDAFKWDTGARVDLLASFGMSLRDIYSRLALTDVSRFGDADLGRLLIGVLAVVGVLFLIIQVVAFSMGLALARSITGSVHELFAGTERVRRGDFTGRVSIKSRDQLGELSASFNSMTASIEDLLLQKAEKERMEQELRIARNIQMSLLPQGPLVMPGISLTAHCEPAREVGGDYYDFLPIDDHTFGILVADVSGKGTSAALYMAELKGIMMSLSQRHRSPRELLIEADRIISRHLDSRSFITVTYLVVDLRAGLLQYARAGHCPLVYVPGPYAQRRRPQLMAPDGLVLGLTLDEGRTFNRLLEEVTLPLGRGDLIVLYTDGITEAMNGDGECFGDARLASLIGQHADLSADELRERILREIDSFTESALQQDDMTMVVLRVEQVGEVLSAPALAHPSTTLGARADA